MKILLILTVSSCLMAGMAMAVIDPDPDSVGIYFDTEANVNHLDAPPFVELPIYVILTNPLLDEIRGYEFGLSLSSTTLIILEDHMHGEGPVDVGLVKGNHIVGLASPMPTTEATILADFLLMPLDDNPVEMTVHDSDPSSVPGLGLPVVLSADYQLYPVGTSSFYGGEAQVNAILNGLGVIATTETTLEQIKSLYR